MTFDPESLPASGWTRLQISRRFDEASYEETRRKRHPQEARHDAKTPAATIKGMNTNMSGWVSANGLSTSETREGEGGGGRVRQ